MLKTRGIGEDPRAEKELMADSLQRAACSAKLKSSTFKPIHSLNLP
jgi:hypothetical protein